MSEYNNLVRERSCDGVARKKPNKNLPIFFFASEQQKKYKKKMSDCFEIRPKDDEYDFDECQDQFIGFSVGKSVDSDIGIVIYGAFESVEDMVGFFQVNPPQIDVRCTKMNIWTPCVATDDAVSCREVDEIVKRLLEERAKTVEVGRSELKHMSADESAQKAKQEARDAISDDPVPVTTEVPEEPFLEKSSSRKFGRGRDGQKFAVVSVLAQASDSSNESAFVPSEVYLKVHGLFGTSGEADAYVRKKVQYESKHADILVYPTMLLHFVTHDTSARGSVDKGLTNTFYRGDLDKVMKTDKGKK